MDSTARNLLHTLYRTMDAAVQSLAEAPLTAEQIERVLATIDDVNAQLGDMLRIPGSNTATLVEELARLEGRLARLMANLGPLQCDDAYPSAAPTDDPPLMKVIHNHGN